MTTHHLPQTGRLLGGRPRILRLLAAVPILLTLVLGIVLGGATASSALTATGAAYGHRDASNGRWLGSWAFDDGTVGFCINLDLPIPPGHAYEHVDGSSLGWFTPEDAARLAYLSRHWGASQNADEAAAGQLATWIITGLNGWTPAQIAARAGASADRVLSRAHQMLAEADGPGGASRGASATMSIQRGEDGFDLVRTELAVDFISSGVTTLPPGTHTGTVTLDGATFEDGTSERAVGNGESLRILPSTDAAVVAFSANATFGELPYGAGLTIAQSAANVQSVLIARPITVAAGASADRERPTPLPFQPIVVTTTSHVTATPGTEISDRLSVGIATNTGLAAEWGLIGPEGGPYTPIPVTVRSQLLGPFAERPVEAPEVPLGAPVVCEVETLVDAGPGEYTTPSCILPDDGYYVWVERIEPSDTLPENGGTMIRPWRSAFGVASEITLASTPPVHEERLAETGADDRSLLLAGSTATGALALGGVLLAFRRRLALSGPAAALSGRRAGVRAGRGRRPATAPQGSR
ncbi:hypothetical protein SAMN06295909_2700 [Plantibacter sp. VKM Ac-1784]|uniref:LPXTG-motif cell wall-anchored protein n=1 Tax=Plantibacter elymi (nom. nud.) TaxID=199708 RepID=A0ABY1REV5_9MICO|nr:hypothetical protein [Plantibacter sp. VKM Ac-1784]SMQ72409.1 hypothetical protein SAMN06295909_2700 [Plantibacter sp. VKM Ac-1784]